MNWQIFVSILMYIIPAFSMQENAHDFFSLGGGRGSKGKRPLEYTLYYQYAARWGRPL